MPIAFIVSTCETAVRRREDWRAERLRQCGLRVCGGASHGTTRPFPQFLLLRRRKVMITGKLMALSCAGTAAIVAGIAFAEPVAEGGRKFIKALSGQAELNGAA